jgi:hypothetical protein
VVEEPSVQVNTIRFNPRLNDAVGQGLGPLVSKLFGVDFTFKKDIGRRPGSGVNRYTFLQLILFTFYFLNPYSYFVDHPRLPAVKVFHSSFLIHYSLFIIPYSYFVDHPCALADIVFPSLFLISHSLFLIPHSLFLIYLGIY